MPMNVPNIGSPAGFSRLLENVVVLPANGRLDSKKTMPTQDYASLRPGLTSQPPWRARSFLSASFVAKFEELLRVREEQL